LVLAQMRLEREYFKGRWYPSRFSTYFTARKSAVSIRSTVWL